MTTVTWTVVLLLYFFCSVAFYNCRWMIFFQVFFIQRLMINTKKTKKEINRLNKMIVCSIYCNSYAGTCIVTSFMIIKWDFSLKDGKNLDYYIEKEFCGVFLQFFFLICHSKIWISNVHCVPSSYAPVAFNSSKFKSFSLFILIQMSYVHVDVFILSSELKWLMIMLNVEW